MPSIWECVIVRIERKNNAKRNFFFGVIAKILQMLLNFLLRTALIYFMGVEYLGLNSIFTSILEVLNLAELGVGSAMVYSMYKPIVEDDTVTICALMKLYRFYYRIIGLVIAIIGLILTPFIPYLIKSDFPDDVNIYVLYLLNLFVTVLSYWLFAYKNSIFDAYQRTDVKSKVSLIINIIQFILKMLVLIFLKGYYFYILVSLLTQIITNVTTAVIAAKKYPDYKPIGRLDNEFTKRINKRIRDLFTAKLGTVIVNSVDTIVISAFLGLNVLAVYQNYYFIITSIIGFITIIFQACVAGIGNSIIVETKEKNFDDLKNLSFIIFWISGFCTVCLLCLYQPFMDIWVGEDLKLEFIAVIYFCIYFFVYEINQLLNTYKDAGGIWHKDRFRPLITALSNLLMNLVMVQFWGVYGVILSTVLSTLFIGIPWLLHNLFTILFDRKQLIQYLKKLFIYTIITFIACVITYLICSQLILPKWILFFERILICLIVPNIIFFIAYNKTPEFKYSIQFVSKTLIRKIF